MGNLFGSLISAAGAVKTYNRALDVVQNNVANASTPGYAASRVNTIAQSFDPESGQVGGSKAGPIESSRDPFVERSVWRQQNAVGQSTQTVQSLSPLEAVLGVAAEAPIPSGLDSLFQSFAHLATTPNDTTARQQILDNASQLASSINSASKALTSAAADTDQQIRGAVDQINQIVGEVAHYNQQVSSGAISRDDTGSESTVYASLENLSQLVDFTSTRTPGGQFEIRLGNGQSPLLLANQQFQLTPDFSASTTGILRPQGDAVGAQVQSGKIAGLLDTRNRLIPVASAELDTLARGIADQVNSTLNQGVDANGNRGANLFSYDPSAPAATLSVTSIGTGELAAAVAAAPGGAGNVADLVALADRPLLNGSTFTGFYGNLAGRIGREKNSADQNQQLHQQLLAQAQAVREQTSGVSLDQEATRLIEFQRAYQAAAQLLGVLNQLTEVVINMLRAS